MNEQLKITIFAEISKFQKNIDNAKKKLKDLYKNARKDTASINKTIKGLGDASKAAFKTLGTAVAGATAALLTLSVTTKEYTESQAMLQTAFETAGGSAEAAKNTYNDLYRVLGDTGQATEAAQHLSKLTTEEQALNEWTTICQGVYATFGASLPIESLAEASNETAKTGEITGALADALNWAGVSEDAFAESLFKCNSEAEREALIRKTLSGLYGKAASAYETNNAAVLEQNEAQNRLNASLAELGEATAPVMTMLMDMGAQIATALAPTVLSFATSVMPSIISVLGTLLEILISAFNWMTQHQTLMIAIASIIGVIVGAITLYNTVAAIKAAMDAMQVTSIGALIAAHWAQAAAAMAALAPYLLIVAAIAAIIAIIVLCVKHWDDISAAAVKAWEWIKKAWSAAANWVNEKVVKPIVQFFTNLWTSITGIGDKIKNSVVNAFNGLKQGASNAITNTVSAVKNTFSKVTSALTSPIEKARDTVKTIIDKIKGFFKFEWSLPKLKVPKFAITPSGWTVGDLLQGVIPKLGITWNARGGVFDKPTLMDYGGSLQGLGENGAEAVVPLENNLEWLNKLANMLADRMGAGTPVILQVDGKTFATTAINSINQLTKQTGKLKLNLI